MKPLLETIHGIAVDLWAREGILKEGINVTAAPLSIKEAISYNFV